MKLPDLTYFHHLNRLTLPAFSDPSTYGHFLPICYIVYPYPFRMGKSSRKVKPKTGSSFFHQEPTDTAQRR